MLEDRDTHLDVRVIAGLVERGGLLAPCGGIPVAVAVTAGHGQVHDVASILRTEGGLASTKVRDDQWQIARTVVASRE